MRKLEESFKVDTALPAQALNSAAATGQYFSLGEWGRALFAVLAGAIADTKTVILQIMQATDAAGTGAKVITHAAATITAPAGASKATITADTVVDGDAITINDTVFTAEDTNPSAANGQYATGADDTAAMAALAVVVNSLLGDTVLASAAAGVLTLTALEPGKTTITITDAAATLVPAVVEAVAYVEVEQAFLDTDNDFTHVAARVTTDANIPVSVLLLRGQGGYSPTQHVAASKSDVAA